jgi:hypothetical protein
MIRHRHIQRLLYDYLKCELPQRESTRVGEHIARCNRCRSEAEELSQLLGLSARAFGTLPSDERPDEFWADFVAGVEKNVQEGNPSPRTQESVLDLLGSFLILRWRPVAAVGGLLAVLFFGLLLGRRAAPPELSRVVSPAGESAASTDTELSMSDEQVGRYLRKSRTLLVGFANMPTDEQEPPDLATEQQVSRELIHEARALKEHPVDIRSAQLIKEMEPILVELASINPGKESPDVELIRGGIRKENLLFKIRMEEARYARLPVIPAKHTYSKEP